MVRKRFDEESFSDQMIGKRCDTTFRGQVVMIIGDERF
jgi:hypothetical protein